MTGTDLIVAAPWIIFAAALTVVCIRLFHARRTSRQQAARRDAAEQQPEGSPHPQGTQCPNNNAQAPWS
jgi:hypothetical protein